MVHEIALENMQYLKKKNFVYLYIYDICFQASSHSVNGMHLCQTSNNHSILLTAGSDMRIRYWDLNYPANSFIMANAASDPLNPPIVSYRSV